MPTILPIRDLRKTSEISELAHKKKEPIFITKNGYSDLVVMSSELYEQMANVMRIDQAIYEAEKEDDSSTKELKAQIKELKAENKALTGKLEDIKKQLEKVIESI